MTPPGYRKNKKALLWANSAKGWFFNRLLTGLLVLHFKHLTQAVKRKGDKILDFDWISIVAKCKNKYKHYEEIKKATIDKMFHNIFFKSVQIVKKKISFLPCMKVKNELASWFFQQALCLNTEPPACLRSVFLQLHPTLVQLSGFPKGSLQTEEKPLLWCWQALWHFSGPLLAPAFRCWPHRCK